jgi:hypothetical protein
VGCGGVGGGGVFLCHLHLALNTENVGVCLLVMVSEVNVFTGLTLTTRYRDAFGYFNYVNLQNDVIAVTAGRLMLGAQLFASMLFSLMVSEPAYSYVE